MKVKLAIGHVLLLLSLPKVCKTKCASQCQCMYIVSSSMRKKARTGNGGKDRHVCVGGREMHKKKDTSEKKRLGVKGWQIRQEFCGETACPSLIQMSSKAKTANIQLACSRRGTCLQTACCCSRLKMV